MTVNRRVNLFEIALKAPPTGAGDNDGADIGLDEALSEIAKLTYDTSDYSLPTNRYHFRPDKRARYGFDFKREGELYVGIIGRNDLDGGQTEAAGVVTDLNLGADEGIHHATHFVLDPQRRLLLLESNASGPRPGDFARYMEARLDGQLDTGVEYCALTPVIDVDRLNRFEDEMGDLATLEVAVLRPNLGRLAASGNAGVATEVNVMIDALRGVAQLNVGIEYLSLVLKRRPFARSGGLGAPLKRATAWLARHRSTELERLHVRAEDQPDGSGKSEMLDLLSAKTGRLITGIPVRTNRNIIVSAEMHDLMLTVYAEM